MIPLPRRSRRNRRLQRAAAFTALGLCCLPLAATETTPRNDYVYAQTPARFRPESHHHAASPAVRQVVSFVHAVDNRSRRPMRHVDVTVALPISNRRQTIHEMRFDPRPREITQDAWGQKTARFHLDSIEGGEERQIRVVVIVSLRALEWLITDLDVGAPQDIPRRVTGRYLCQGGFYGIDHTALAEAAVETRSSSGGFLEQVRNIHDFVVDQLKYERDDRWDTAADVLRRGTGSCSEYSFLMIALCRLNGIPARYAGGTCLPRSMTSEVFDRGHPGAAGVPGVGPDASGAAEREGPLLLDRVFHRWVEVYIPRMGWFPIDPTRNDSAGDEGDPYRYFGKLPWFYLTMSHGDGGCARAGALGDDYRSGMRWSDQESFDAGDIRVQRYAVWKDEAAPTLTLRATGRKRGSETASARLP